MTEKPNFKNRDHETWKTLFTQQSLLRDQQLIPEFGEGLKKLGITEDRIPDIDLVNERLEPLSGWRAVYTSGFVEADGFFKMLSEKKFPIGNFIRDPNDLSYTPAPDVFHDLYGHIPFLTIPDYAKFCEKFGSVAVKHQKNKDIIEQFQRLFWFTIEFALVKTTGGFRIFGAGIASSFTECAYALSGAPKLLNFDLEAIRQKKFRIDVIQDELFLLESAEQLYRCIDDFSEIFRKEKV